VIVLLVVAWFMLRNASEEVTVIGKHVQILYIVCSLTNMYHYRGYNKSDIVFYDDISYGAQRPTKDDNVSIVSQEQVLSSRYIEKTKLLCIGTSCKNISYIAQEYYNDTFYHFIITRPGCLMPPYSERYSESMNNGTIEELTNYIKEALNVPIKILFSGYYLDVGKNVSVDEKTYHKISPKMKINITTNIFGYTYVINP
jgi:hypothetical protein